MTSNSFGAVIYVLVTRLVLPAVVVGGAVFGVCWFTAPGGYVARAKFQRRNDAAMTTMGPTMTDRQLEPIRASLEEDFRGRQSLSHLIDDLTASDHDVGLRWQLPRDGDGSLTAEGQMLKDALIDRLQQAVSVRYLVQADQFDFVEVSCTHADPELAQKAVNRLVENYIHNTRDQLNAMLLNAKKFFATEVERYRAAVIELETKRAKYLADRPGFEPDDLAGMVRRLADARRRLDEIGHADALTPERKDERDRLLQQVKDLDDWTAMLFNPENRYRQMEDALAEAHRQFDFWHERLRSTTLALTAEVAQRGVHFSFVSRASDEPEPVEIDPWPMLRVAGIIGGSVGGLVLLTQGIVNLGVRERAGPRG
jgi:cell division septum initiation protein DivIVA